MTFSVGTSSVKKGESLRDTVADHRGHGRRRHRRAPRVGRRARGRSPAGSTSAVINAGDGWHEHPTQALLDCYTIRQHLGSLDGPQHRHRRRHQAQPGGPLRRAGLHRARRRGHAGRPADAAAADPRGLAGQGQPRPRRRAARRVDVVYLLRMQQERMTEALVPDACASTRPATASPPARADAAGRRRADHAPRPDEPRRRDRRRGRRPAQRRRSSTRCATASPCAWRCCSCCSARARPCRSDRRRIRRRSNRRSAGA